MGFEIGLHAFAKGFRAEVVFNGQQHVAGLAVGNAVEHLVDFVGRFSLGADGARGGLRIQVERVLLLNGDDLRYMPLRMHGGNGLVLHPGGEAFVEPDVVPPLHGHQVAEPLVSHLVGDHQRHVFLGIHRRCFGIEEQVGFAVGDGAKVFHGSCLEVGQANQIELLERVGNSEVGVVVVQYIFGNFDAIRSERNLVGRGAYADGDAVLAAAGALEVADQEREQIRTHFGSGPEVECMLVRAGTGPVRRDGSV